jgi:hypothetical protein
MSPMKPISNEIMALLEEYEIDPKEALWNCHGTWVMYHKYIEKIARIMNIHFQEPTIIEGDYSTGTAVILVTGYISNTATTDKRDMIVWSIGESHPTNTSNKYPYAMAEKRAKDRVILKLAGIHGYIYSEEEADEFKEKKVAAEPLDDSISPAQLIVIEGLSKSIHINKAEKADIYEWLKKDITAIEAADEIERIQKLIADRR